MSTIHFLISENLRHGTKENLATSQYYMEELLLRVLHVISTTHSAFTICTELPAEFQYQSAPECCTLFC